MVASGRSSMTRYQQRKQQQCVLRTLENLPMKYDSDDSRSLATSYRSIRSASMDEAKWASKVSQNQLSQSRRLFDDCLKQKREEDIQQGERVRSSRSDATYRSPSVHSGPTRYGSPLYTYTQQNLPSQARTPSEPPPKYFRARSPIEDTLRRSNSVYRVSPRVNLKPHSAKAPTSYPNFDLVPKSEIHAEDTYQEERQSITPVHIMARRPYVKMNISSLYPEPTMTLLDSMPLIKLDQGDGEAKEYQADDKTSVKAPSIQRQINVKDKSEENKDQPKSSSQLAVNVGCSKGSSMKSTSSIRGKHDTGTTGDKGSIKSARRKGAKKSGEQKSKVPQLSPPGLPTYICPSSEEKSREARIRHWLCDNSFSCADRQVPLIF